MEDKVPSAPTQRRCLRQQRKLITEEGGEEDVPLHGTINEEEACIHTQNLEKILDDLASKIESWEPDSMKQAINSLKEAILAIILGMEEANPVATLGVVKDPSSLAIHPTQKRESTCWRK